MTDTHSTRGHAEWSASATARNVTCAGALAMATLAGEEKESIHAAKGTAGHTAGEDALRKGEPAQCLDWLGKTVKTKDHEIEIDEEIANSAQEYVDYVRAQIPRADIVSFEQYYSLASLNPPFDAGGTCDSLLVYLKEQLLEIVDFKNGMFAVSATNSWQLRSYALLALLNLPKEIAGKITKIKVTIVQPRAPHRDGRIRSETFHIADLVLWTADLMEKMHKSKAAMVEFEKIAGNRLAFEEWADQYLTVGQCKFCPAEGFCPKLKTKALKIAPAIAKEWFEDPTLVTPAVLSNSAQIGSPEELAHDLDGFEMLESWIAARRAYAHTQAERGTTIPGYQLSDKISNRKWAADDKKVAGDLKSVVKLTDDQIWVKKLASPAQVEKIIGAKRKAEISNMAHRVKTGTNLVSVDKTTRPPAATLGETFFEKAE